MEFLKRELAPITNKAWEEIEERAKSVLSNNLSGRRAINVCPPKGRSFEGISTGRMGLKQKDDLFYGVYKIQPLVETRISFVLNRWELDNIERGAKDVNFDALDEAVKKAAKFEDSAIFYGLPEACIEGLKSSAHPVQKFGTTDEETIKSMIAGIKLLRDSTAKKPYILVVSEEKWVYLNTVSKDPEFLKKLEKMIGNPIVVSENVKEAFLMPYDDENLELALGMDYSIGYQDSDDVNVKLFITSSFAFRVLDKSLVVVFE